MGLSLDGKFEPNSLTAAQIRIRIVLLKAHHEEGDGCYRAPYNGTDLKDSGMSIAVRLYSPCEGADKDRE